MDVGAYERGEGSTGTQRCPSPASQGELSVSLGLFLERHGQDGAMLSHLYVRRRHNGSSAADRAGSVHAEHRLADRAQSVREVELGFHDAFEEVGGLSKDDSVDVGHGHPGVIECPEHRLSHQATEGHIETARLVVRLADSNHSAGACAHGVSATMQTRFCCRHGPDVEWASARCPPLIT